jgi:hypothetical protein
MRRKFSEVLLHYPPKLFATRYSPFAAVFGSAGALPSHFIPSLVPRPASHSKSALSFSVINYGPKSVAWFVFSTLWDY